MLFENDSEPERRELWLYHPNLSGDDYDIEFKMPPPTQKT